MNGHQLAIAFLSIVVSLPSAGAQRQDISRWAVDSTRRHVPLPPSILRRYGTEYNGVDPRFPISEILGKEDTRVVEHSYGSCVSLARETYATISRWAQKRASLADSLFVFAPIAADDRGKSFAFIWIIVDSTRRGVVYGRVRNGVQGGGRPALGEPVRVSVSRIWDWVITEPGLRPSGTCVHDIVNTRLRPSGDRASDAAT